MSEDKITQALSRLFERQRIVFWYDAKRELRNSFEALNMQGVAGAIERCADISIN